MYFPNMSIPMYIQVYIIVLLTFTNVIKVNLLHVDLVLFLVVIPKNDIFLLLSYVVSRSCFHATN